MRGPEMSTGAPKSDKPAPDTECPHAAAQIGRERAYLRHIRIRNLHFSNDLWRQDWPHCNRGGEDEKQLQVF
jgi:hypothetical protein